MENVNSYTKVLLDIFDGKDGGCAKEFDDGEHLLRRALMTFSPYYFGMEKNCYWCFCSGLDEWREYVNTKDECRNALYGLLKDVLVPAQKQSQCLRLVLSDYVESISSKYEQNILATDENSFRHHFIHHPGVWDYMGQFCEFNNYVNSPVAFINGETYNMPFNMNTFSKLWGVFTPAEAKAKIAEVEILMGKSLAEARARGLAEEEIRKLEEQKQFEINKIRSRAEDEKEQIRKGK